MLKIDIKHEGVEYAEVNPISFRKFVDLSVSVYSDDARNRLKLIQRKRLLVQCKFFDGNGVETPFDDLKITQLPPTIGRNLVTASNVVLGVEGTPEVISRGEESNGVTGPVLMKLAQPLKSSKEEINELEFHARTFGDIEAAFSESHPMLQTLILIESIAKPVMSSLKLQALPSWAVDQLSVIDGSYIAEHILPDFLG